MGFLPLSTTSPRGWFIPLSPVILTDRYLEWSVYTLCAQVNFEEIVSKDTTINIRIDANTKKKAEKIFARCGYTTSTAIRLFLLRTIKENDWPFDIHPWRNDPEFHAQLERESKDTIGPFSNLKDLFTELNTPDEDEALEEPAVIKSKKRAKR